MASDHFGIGLKLMSLFFCFVCCRLVLIRWLVADVEVSQISYLRCVVAAIRLWLLTRYFSEISSIHCVWFTAAV